MNTFLISLNEKNVDYRIIDKSSNHLRILMKNSDKDIFINLLKDSGYKNTIHNLSKNNGYVYRYQLHELELYAKDEKKIEIYYELPCMSLTPKTLIPLDKLIQNEAWKNVNQIGNMKFLSEEIYMVFLVTQCIFGECCFDNNAQRFLQEKKEILNSKKVNKYLKKIFFSYTDQLIRLLNQNNFADIYIDYISFLNY